MKLYHYAVFLRCNGGTVRRNVAIGKRDIRQAGRVAQDAVSRHLAERVTVLDVVPLRERAGGPERTLKARSKRPVTVTRVKYVLARKPKARQSLILTKRGVRPWESRIEETVTPYERASDKVSGKPDPPRTCESPACMQRGTCKHGKPMHKAFLVYAQGRRKRSPRARTWVPVVTFTWVVEPQIKTREAARARTQALLRQAGLRDVQVTDCFTIGQATRKGLARRPVSYFEGSQVPVAKVLSR